MSLREEFHAAILAAGDTESTYRAYWPHIEHFIKHTRSRRGSPVDRHQVSVDDVYAFREHLSARCHRSPKSVNQAMSALKFLFVHVIGSPLEPQEGKPIRCRESKRARRRMISRDDLVKFLDALPYPESLIARLQYAAVLRLSDVLQLRIKDLNFGDEQIEIAQTKHDHFRIVPFPKSIHELVRKQLESVRVLHAMDEERNPNGVPVPHSFATKSPTSPRQFAWYWLFPSDNLSRDPADNRLKRYHRDADHVRRRMRDAVSRSGIDRRLTPHDLRRIAATHLHLSGMPLKKLQDILGHTRLEQTRDYIMDDDAAVSGSDSPFDSLFRSA